MIKIVWKCINIIAISPKSGMEQEEIMDTFWSYRLHQTLCQKLKKPMKQMLMPLLLFRHQGHTLSSKHSTTASLSPSNGLFLFLRLLLVLSLTTTLSTGLRFRSQCQGCLGFQVLHQHPDHSISMAS